MQIKSGECRQIIVSETDVKVWISSWESRKTHYNRAICTKSVKNVILEFLFIHSTRHYSSILNENYVRVHNEVVSCIIFVIWIVISWRWIYSKDNRTYPFILIFTACISAKAIYERWLLNVNNILLKKFSWLQWILGFSRKSPCFWW
jgi:hypothetical protein